MVEVSKLSLGQLFALHEVLQYISVLRGSSLMWINQQGGKLLISSFTFLAKKSETIHRFKWIRNKVSKLYTFFELIRCLDKNLESRDIFPLTVGVKSDS